MPKNIIIEHELTPTYNSPANSSLALAAWVFVVPLAARPRGISLIRSFQESYIYQTCAKKQKKHIRSNLNSLLRQKKRKLASSEHHPQILIVGCQTNERTKRVRKSSCISAWMTRTRVDTCGPRKIIKFLKISSPRSSPLSTFSLR